MSNKIILGVLVVLALGVFIFFLNVPIGLDSNNVDDDRLKVTASFYPLAFFAEQIGGAREDRADVYNITPAGAEPHEYELTAQDVARIQNSDLLLLNGGGLEPWARNIGKNIANNEVVIINAGERFISLERLEDNHNDEESEEHEEEHEGEMDPHVWLSPILASKMVDVILAGFVDVDVENMGYYEANVTKLKDDLNELDMEFRKGLANCAKDAIVTSHSAFGYLAREYGFEQVAITGLSPEAEPSVREFAEIAEFARDRDIKYIFFESLVSPRLAEALANEVGAETLILNPLEGLTQQELIDGKDYFSEMRKNLTNLQIALQCQKKN